MARMSGIARARRILVDRAEKALPRWRAVQKIEAGYRQFFGHGLAENPAQLTGKIFRRMTGDVRRPNPLLTILADKHAVRPLVGELIGQDHLVPILWTGKDPAQIPFDQLPERSMAKVTHSSGSNFVLRAGADRRQTIRRLRKNLNSNHYWYWREHWYLPIKGRVQILEYLDDGHPNGPLDYRFWCFNGEPVFVQVDDRYLGINPFYDLDWNKLNLRFRCNCQEIDVPRPEGLDAMTMMARTLSTGFGFVRVDFFDVRGKVYFAEMTFAPGAGRFRIEPREWDVRLGAMWTRPDPRSVSEWHLQLLRRYPTAEVIASTSDGQNSR